MTDASVVFANNLSPGVAAVARAIGVRQAKDMLYVAEHGQDFSIDNMNAHLFPAGDCATAILRIAAEAEAAIPGLDMSPVVELVCDFANRPLRPHWTTPHDWLSTLAELSLSMHLVIEYTDDEQIAVRRLFAAIHLAVCGPLPVGNWGARDHHEIVGCSECIADHSGRKGTANLPTELAFAARDGEIDPKYTPPVFPPGYKFGQPYTDTRERDVRLTWRAPSVAIAEQIANELGALGFSVSQNDRWATVSAQKPLRGEIQQTMAWGSQRFAKLGGVTWYGAEAVFSR